MTKNIPDPLSRSRYRGCLLGLAAGDAVGTSVEFMGPGSFTPLTDMIGGGPFNLNAGEWTDDTSMALCLAESLVQKGGFDPIDQLERYLRWYRSGYLSSNGRCFDIGNTIRQALLRFERTHEPYPGSESPNAAGNGSLMRLAPVPMFFARRPRMAIERCADSSRTTHAARQAVDACKYYGALILGALHGRMKDELLSPPDGWEFLGTDATVLLVDLDPAIMDISNGAYKQRQPPEIKGNGYVVRGMEAALWVFHHSDAYREGVLMAANLGDDADTTAAIYGQLAGAYYGEDAVPGEWRAKLSMVDLITNLADRLWEQGMDLVGRKMM